MDLKKIENFKKIIYFKLNLDLFDKVIKPYAGEFWVIDPKDNKWFLRFTNQGELRYNQTFFNNFFSLFSLEFKEFQPFIKDWFEYNFDLSVNEVQRVNSIHDYFVINIINNEKPWSIKDRNGFAYYFVKKYLDLQKNIKESDVIIEHYIRDYNTTPTPISI
jgi:hypothetical protein